MEEGTRWRLSTEDKHVSNTEAVAVITGADVLSGLNDSVVEHSASFVARNEQPDVDVNDASFLTTQEKLCLSTWGLPETILERYASRGVVSMFPWQLRCLQQGAVLSGRNLVYSAPTSAGKTLVAEILAIKTVLERRKKVIFVLPFVSVVREKMHYFQHLLSTSGVRVAGLMGSQSLPGGFSRVHMAICTIEKANSLINRLLEEGTLASLGALVVDELHLIGDPFRGYLLELLLAKVKFVAERLGLDIQIIGMSATLPNLDHLATWLDAELFTTDFRPVPLKELFKCGDDVYDRELHLLYRIRPQIKINNDPDHVIHMCLETVTNGHSALIFCPTKTWCESLATSLASNVRTLGCGTGPLAEQLRAQLVAAPLTELLAQLRSCAAGLDAVLGRCVQYGVAFHHAGLTMDEREILEAGFRGNVLRLLVATSTLSSGVNLPARRVIVRTAYFHGKPLEAAAYHQMAGRAGRTGCDTQGESFLMFKPNEMAALRRMVAAQPAAVRSCLEPPAVGLSSSMKRALLEVIAGGVANTMEELRHFVSCTLMGCMAEAESSDQDETEESIEATESSKATESKERWPLQAYIAFLLRNELIRRQETGEGNEKSTRLMSTALGGACLASALHPDEALALFRELQRARQSFVLENDLHVVYLVTPYSVAAQLGNLDWMQVLRVWKRLPPDLKRVGALVGVREAALAMGAAGALPADGADVALARRFHTALALLELLNEAPLARVAAEFGCSRGLLQALQQGAATYAGVVRAFCSRLRWHTLERLVEEFAPRLELGVARELLPLARLELLDGPRARAVHDAGFTTLPVLAAAQVCDVETALMAATPFQSVAGVAGESAYEAARRQQRRLVCLTGRAGLTERQAAEMLITAARELVQRDLELATEALMPANRPQPVTPSSLPNVSALSDGDESQAETLPRFVIGLQGEKRPKATKIADLHSSSKTSSKSLTSNIIETTENDIHAAVKKDTISPVVHSASESQYLKSLLKSPDKSFISVNLQFASEVKDRLSCDIANINALSNGVGLDKPAVPLSPTLDFSSKAPEVLASNPEKYQLLPLIEAGHKGRTECSESDTSVENTPPSTRTSKRMEKILQHRSNSGVKYSTLILPSQELDDSPEFGEETLSNLSSVQHPAVAGNSCEPILGKLKVNPNNGKDSAELLEIDTNKPSEPRPLGIKSVVHCQNNMSGRTNAASPALASTARGVPMQVTSDHEIQECNLRNTTASCRYQSPKLSETTPHVKSTSKIGLASHLVSSTPENAENLRLHSRHTPDIPDIPQCDTDLFSSPLELPNLTAMLRLENGLASNRSLGESKNLSARSRVSMDMFDSPSPLPADRPLVDRDCMPNDSTSAREDGALDSPSCLPRIGNQGSDSPVKLANAACRLSLDSRKSSLFGDSFILESQFYQAVAVANGDMVTSRGVLSDNECEGSVKDSSYFNESPKRVDTETMIKVSESAQIFGGRDRLASGKGPVGLGNSNNNRIESPASDLKVNSGSLFQSFEVDTQFDLELNAINEKDKTELNKMAINKREKSEVALTVREKLKTDLDENAESCDTKNISEPKCSIARVSEVSLEEGLDQNIIAQGCNLKLNSIHSKVNIESTNIIKSSSLNFEDSLSIDTQLNLVLNSDMSSKIFRSPPRKSKQSIKTNKTSSVDVNTPDIASVKSTSINFEESLTLDTQLNLVLNSSNSNPASKISSEHSAIPCNESSQSSPEMFDESLGIDTQLGLAIDAANQTTSRPQSKTHSSKEVTDKSVAPPVLAIPSLPRHIEDSVQRLLIPATKQIVHKIAGFENKSFKSPVLSALPKALPHLPTESKRPETLPIVVRSKNVSPLMPNTSSSFIDSSISDQLDMNIGSTANNNTASFSEDVGSALQNNSLEDVVMCTPPSTACSSKSFARGGKRKKKRKLSPEEVLSCKKAKGPDDAYRERDLPSESFESNGLRCSTRSTQSRHIISGKVPSSGVLKQSGRFYEVNSEKDVTNQNGNKHETKMTRTPFSKRSVTRKVINDGPVGESEKLISQALAVRWCNDLDLDGSWQRLEAALESGADVALALASNPAVKKSGPLIGSAILGRRSTPDSLVPSGQTVVTGFALSFGGMEAFFVPLEHGTDKRECRGLRLLLSLRNLRMYGAQEQLTTLLRSCQVSLDARLFDPLVVDWLVDSTRPDPGLLVATQRECGSPSELLALLGRLGRTEMKPAAHTRPLRAALDAVSVWHLSELRKERLTSLPSDVVEVEMSVLSILAASDSTGMYVDCARKSSLRDQISAAILRHPAQARKCRAMLAALNGLGLAERVHPRSDPLGATGRITTHAPNVQCTPRDIALPHDATLSLRSIFIASPGEVLVAADFCQLELRLLAHLSGDSRLREAVTFGGDAFAHLAASWYHVRLEQVSDEQRSTAKAACYGLIYGMGSRLLAEKLGIEQESAIEVVQQFNATFPGAAVFVEKTLQGCRETGYITTLCGRRRYLPAITSHNSEERSSAERQAVNSTIQGSAADVFKRAMVNVWRLLPPGAKLVLHLHDELMVQVIAGSVQATAEALKLGMSRAVSLSVPLPVKITSGPSWADQNELRG